MDEQVVRTDRLAGSNIPELAKHPYSQQNRFTTDWVDFVAEHVDVDRPGDRTARISA
jgi:hypothetical protein